MLPNSVPSRAPSSREFQVKEVEGIPEELKRLFVTALEIPPERHLQMQAAFQRHVDKFVEVEKGKNPVQANEMLLASTWADTHDQLLQA
jgi:ribonucleotide reductase alpha subunit